MRARVTIEDLPSIAAENVCILKPSAFGDVVQASAILPALRQRFPSARLSWVVNRTLVDLLSGHPDLDELLTVDRRGGFAASWRFLRELRARRFDLVLDLQGLLRTAVMSWATRAPLRIGLQTAREGARHSCHVTLPNTGRHEPAHSRYQRVAEAFGAGDVPRRARIHVPEAAVDWALAKLGCFPSPWFAVHAGARWTTKRWPVEKFAAVAAKTMRQFDHTAVLVGGPEEADTSASLASLIGRLHPDGRVLDLTGRTNLKQLAALLASVDLLFTNDSGPMHLAAEMGTPVVGVFTCTSPIRSGPPGDVHELVATRVPCAASYRKKCPHRGSGHLACLEELATDRVWGAVQRVVGRLQASRRAA